MTANPVGAVGDLVLPEGYRPTDISRGGATALSAMAEGAVTGDTRAAEDFQRRSERGDFGKIMQVSSKSGAYWAKHGFTNTVNDFGREFSGWVRSWF